MAVDMSTVKQIMHNNKEVTKIEDHLGNIIWQKEEDQPYRRLEYLYFDGTNYCASAEHNASNRAYRIEFEQTGWNSSGVCYPFGIYTNTAPQNILLIRNERSNAGTGFEVCRVSNTALGQTRAVRFMNRRIVAEMRWGATTTVNYRLRHYESGNYCFNTYGTASGRTSTNTGNFFIGAINDGGGGSYSNANGMVVGKIYRVDIASVNSFTNYQYQYIPCQRKSDGAIGFKQPSGDFWPLLNKADGSIVTEVSSHMGPVVDNNWDGVTYIPLPTIPTAVTTYPNAYLRSYSSVKDTNYIDFGFKWNSQWRIEGYYYRPSGTIDYGRILGTGYGTYRELQIDYPSSGTYGNQRQLIGNRVDNQNTYTGNTFERYGFACGNRGTTCESWYWSSSKDWNKFGMSWNNDIGISSYNLRFFSATEGDRDGIYGLGNIKILGPDALWDDAGALYYFVPAIKDGEYGMFDTINSTFYPVTTSGNGSFNITNVSGTVIA